MGNLKIAEMAHLRTPNEKIRICTAPRVPSRYVPKRNKVQQSDQESADQELNEFLRKALKQLVETRPPNPIQFLAYELFKAGGVDLPPGSDEYIQYHAAKRIQTGLRGRYAKRRVRRIRSEKTRLAEGVTYGDDANAAANKMQSMRRGKQSRKRVNRISKEKKRLVRCPSAPQPVVANVYVSFRNLAVMNMTTTVSVQLRLFKLESAGKTAD